LEVLLGEVSDIAELVDRARDLLVADQGQLAALERLRDGLVHGPAGVPFDRRKRDLGLGDRGAGYQAGGQRQCGTEYQRQGSSHRSLRCAGASPGLARASSIHADARRYSFWRLAHTPLAKSSKAWPAERAWTPSIAAISPTLAAIALSPGRTSPWRMTSW